MLYLLAQDQWRKSVSNVSIEGDVHQPDELELPVDARIRFERLGGGSVAATDMDDLRGERARVNGEVADICDFSGSHLHPPHSRKQFCYKKRARLDAYDFCERISSGWHIINRVLHLGLLIVCSAERGLERHADGGVSPGE